MEMLNHGNENGNQHTDMKRQQSILEYGNGRVIEKNNN